MVVSASVGAQADVQVHEGIQMALQTTKVEDVSQIVLNEEKLKTAEALEEERHCDFIGQLIMSSITTIAMIAEATQLRPA